MRYPDDHMWLAASIVSGGRKAPHIHSWLQCELMQAVKPGSQLILVVTS